MQALIEQSDFYFANSGRIDLSAEEFNRLQTYRTAVYQNNIMTEYDRILLKQKNEKLQRKISDMKEKLTKKRNKLVRYVDIRDTYESISKRDYVEELVAEEKLRREQEEQKRLQKAKKRKGSR